MKLIYKNVKERLVVLLEEELEKYGDLKNLSYVVLSKEEGEEYLKLLGWNPSCIHYSSGAVLPSFNYMKIKLEGWETYTIPVKYEDK